MCQKDFVPCNCDECYFYLHGHTTGVQHRQKCQKVKVVHVKLVTVVQVDKCSNNVYINLGKGSVITGSACVASKEQQTNMVSNWISYQRDASVRICQKGAPNLYVGNQAMMIVGR